MENSNTISYDDFAKVHIHLGTITKAEPFPRAKKPAYKVWADFGPSLGTLQTSAQITIHYTPDSLIGQKILGVTNIGSRNIAGFQSQFLLLGFPDSNNNIILATTTLPAPNGQKLQ